MPVTYKALDSELKTAVRSSLTGKGKTWYVHASNGSNGNSGKTWDSAFLTMQKAFDNLSSGDTIVFAGAIAEQLTTPVQVFDVTVIGSGNRPRHADTAPAPTGGHAANKWKAPSSPAGTTPLVKVLQQGWRFQNILFQGPSDAASILLYRDGGAGDAERDASHAEIINCRFASGQDGVEQSGGCYNVKIEGCSFHDLTGYAFKTTAGAGIANCYRWEIKGNRVHKCANLFGVWNTHQFTITDNQFIKTTTALIDFSGGEGENVLLRNTFDIAAADFDPAGGVTGKTGDVWNSYLTDAIETGLPAN